MATTSSTSSTTSLAGSGTMSSPGLGSGLDVNGIVSKLMAIERRPIDNIDTETTGILAELTAYGTLKGALSAFQTSVQALSSRSAFAITKATVADTTQLSASSDSTAAVGSYSVKVKQLAYAEKLQSPAFASAADAVGSGTLTFDFGSYSTSGGVTSFTPNTDKQSMSFSIPAESSSLSQIASAINSSSAGISATVLNDGTYNYLSFSSKDPGTANSLRVTVTSDTDGNNTDAAGLSQLAFDKTSGYNAGTQSFTAPASIAVSVASNNNEFSLAVDGGTAATITLPDNTYTSANIVSAMQLAIDGNVAIGPGKVTVSLDANDNIVLTSLATGAISSVSLAASPTPGNTGLSTFFGTSTNVYDAPRRMTETVLPQDAQVYIDNTLVTKSSNTITDAITGVTLNLVKESTTATTLTVASDTSGISTKVEAFVTSYNTLSAMLSTVLSYNATTGESGALQGEGTVRSIEDQLRRSMSTVLSGLGANSLSDVGVSFQRDGSLQFSSTTLQAALSDPDMDVATLFAGDGVSVTGIASGLDSLLDSMLESDGLMTARTDGLNQELATFATQRAQLEARMTLIESRYREQYSKLDALVSSMTSTSTYLTQQLANLPSITSK